MLVLSRKKNELIIIRDQDDKIIMELCITDIRQDKAKIGFNADPALRINRKEVDEKKHAK